MLISKEDHLFDSGHIVSGNINSSHMGSRRVEVVRRKTNTGILVVTVLSVPFRKGQY
jgi:hypothetical protein